MTPSPTRIRAPVLLVDDRAEDLAVLEAVLDAPDIEPVCAASGMSALRHLLDRDFAVILLDVHMPGMSGFDLAEIIKQRDRCKDTPIVFLTADSDDSFITRAYAVGAADFLQKPMHREVVRTKVGVFVELFRRAEALRAAERRERDRQLSELVRKSDERYKNLAEAIPQIVWTAARSGEVTYYNRRWHDFTGLPDEPPPPWTAGLHPDDVVLCEREWRDCVSRGARYEGECRMRSARGDYRWHLCRAVPDTDENGNVIGWLGTHTDFHDLRTALEAADNARVRATFLAEASELLSASLDYPATLARVARLPVPRLADWCVVDVNDTGRHELAVAHMDADREHALRELFAAPNKPLSHVDGKPNGCANGHRDVGADDGALRELAASSILQCPLAVRDRVLGAMTFGSSSRTLGEGDRRTAEDLARHAALAVDNARLYLAAQDALHERDDFLSIAAHELRTPLTTLQLQLQSLQRRISAGEAARAKIESAVRQGQKLAGLTERLLDVSRIVAGRLSLELEELESHGPGPRHRRALHAGGLTGRLRPRARVRRAHPRPLGSAPRRAGGDEPPVERPEVRPRCAGCAGRPAARRRRMDWRARPGHRHLRGGPAAHLRALRARGDREAVRRPRDRAVRRAPDRRGPRGLHPGREPRRGRLGVHRPAPPRGTTRRDRMSLPRPVMIVEDDPDIRAALADVLAEDGHTTITAANGRDALDQLHASSVAPCVIVLDLMMPVMDGWQFAAGLREVSAWSDIPIVVVSAGDDIEAHAEALGAHGHLRKPVDLDNLLATVVRCAQGDGDRGEPQLN